MRVRMARRKGAAAGLAALALLGVMAAAPPAHAQAPVKIGFIYPDSGPFAQLGLDQRDGFLLHWSELGNKAGGRAVDILLETKGTNKPDEGLTKARKLVERDKVQILAGINSTPVAYALRSYVNEKKIPLIITNAGADGLTQKQRSEHIFRSSFVNSEHSHPLGEWAYKQGWRKMVLIASDFAAGIEHIGGVARTFTDAGGQVIQEIYPPLGAPDFAPFLTQIRRDADVVAAFAAGADGLRFVTQYTEYGLKGKIPLIGKSITDEMILPRQGSAALGVINAFQWSGALDTAANRRFVAAYTARYKRPPTTFAEQAYVGAQMIAQALEAVKGHAESTAALPAALGRMEVDAPRGKVTVDPFHALIQNIYVQRVEDKGGALQNTVIATYPNVNQFWKWTPEQYMAMPTYTEMKGKWAK